MSDKEADKLEAGNSLGHYRILKKIGAGGICWTKRRSVSQIAENF